MNTKIGFQAIDLKLREVNRSLVQPLDVYRIVKKYQAPGYEVQRRVGRSAAFECISGDIGLTKEGVIGALCSIGCVHDLYRTAAPQSTSNADFDKAIAEFNDEKPTTTGATLSQSAAFDAALADLLSDEEGEPED